MVKKQGKKAMDQAQDFADFWGNTSIAPVQIARKLCISEGFWIVYEWLQSSTTHGHKFWKKAICT